MSSTNEENRLFFLKQLHASAAAETPTHRFQWVPALFAEDLSIAQSPNSHIVLKDTLQEKMYLLELEKYGQSLAYQLQRVSGSEEYYLLGPQGETIRGSELFHVYAFVIIKKTLENGETKLELRIGTSNHRFVANCAESVIAAGDIYFEMGNGRISKITDQSGGYHIANDDPKAHLKRAQAKMAMQMVGLPMDKFQPFMSEPVSIEPSREILFSQFQTKDMSCNENRLSDSTQPRKSIIF